MLWLHTWTTINILMSTDSFTTKWVYSSYKMVDPLLITAKSWIIARRIASKQKRNVIHSHNTSQMLLGAHIHMFTSCTNWRHNKSALVMKQDWGILALSSFYWRFQKNWLTIITGVFASLAISDHEREKACRACHLLRWQGQQRHFPHQLWIF